MKTCQDITGFFDYHDIFMEVYQKYKNKPNSIFVEIGAYLGKSTAYMCSLIKESSNIKFYTVDNFKGAPSDIAMVKLAKENGGTFRGLFEQNLKDCGLKDFVNIIESDSVKAASLFENNSVDFLFIDGAHEEECVYNDIQSWLKKMKINSLMAGHDWNQKGVQNALHRSFGRFGTNGSSWTINIK